MNPGGRLVEHYEIPRRADRFNPILQELKERVLNVQTIHLSYFIFQTLGYSSGRQLYIVLAPAMQLQPTQLV